MYDLIVEKYLDGKIADEKFIELIEAASEQDDTLQKEDNAY